MEGSYPKGPKWSESLHDGFGKGMKKAAWPMLYRIRKSGQRVRPAHHAGDDPAGPETGSAVDKLIFSSLVQTKKPLGSARPPKNIGASVLPKAPN